LDPYLIQMDLDPGGPKTGFGFATLKFFVLLYSDFSLKVHCCTKALSIVLLTVSVQQLSQEFSQEGYPIEIRTGHTYIFSREAC
jgi:hypothetical protein